MQKKEGTEALQNHINHVACCLSSFLLIIELSDFLIALVVFTLQNIALAGFPHGARAGPGSGSGTMSGEEPQAAGRAHGGADADVGLSALTFQGSVGAGVAGTSSAKSVQNPSGCIVWCHYFKKFLSLGWCVVVLYFLTCTILSHIHILSLCGDHVPASMSRHSRRR